MTESNLNIEQDAILRCQNGDMDAFALLYDLYVKRIYNFIFFRTHHKETAEDLTSVVFTKAFQNFHTFKGSKGLFSAWLFKIARNTVIDNNRTGKPTVDLEAAANAKARDDVAGEVEIRDRLDHIKNYLNQLSEEQREIVIMRLWDELTYAEISSLTGKTEGNCKVIFSRVLQKLQKELLPNLVLMLIVLKSLINH